MENCGKPRKNSENTWGAKENQGEQNAKPRNNQGTNKGNQGKQTKTFLFSSFWEANTLTNQKCEGKNAEKPQLFFCYLFTFVCYFLLCFIIFYYISQPVGAQDDAPRRTNVLEGSWQRSCSKRTAVTETRQLADTASTSPIENLDKNYKKQ